MGKICLVKVILNCLLEILNLPLELWESMQPLHAFSGYWFVSQKSVYFQLCCFLKRTATSGDLSDTARPLLWLYETL